MFCEHESCRARAVWVVGVGARQSDRQRSCSKHLAWTCTVMLEADKPRKATLTVESFWKEGKR